MVVAAPQTNKQTTLAPKPASKNFVVRLAPYLLWQLIALLVVELVLFSAGIGEEEIFKLDPVLGTKHMSNKRVTWRSEGYAQSYFNEDGMRETGLTVAKSLGTYRVALLGDSMVEGLQVPLKDTFGQVMQRHLQADLKMPVQVLNFGTSGYSTAQEYLQLKTQVMKYKPDLVLLFYNSRDIFENWSPPDQTITNVRPIALHLPGGHLIVDSMPVVVWMHTKHARFLQQIAWLRENSRIWGLISAQQTEWSFSSPIYRALTKLFHQPGVAIKELVVALLPKAGSAPSFNIAKFETTSPGTSAASTSGTTTAANSSVNGSGTTTSKIAAASSTNHDSPARQELIKPEFNSAAPNQVLAKGATQAAAAVAASNHGAGKAVDGKKTYIDLITRTESSLFAEMLKTCQQGGAKFSVVIIPVRSAICPAANMETEFLGIDYGGEIKIIDSICKGRSIPMFDDQILAAALSRDQSPTLFYSVHLTPKGHQFVADTIYPFVFNQVSGKQVSANGADQVSANVSTSAANQVSNPVSGQVSSIQTNGARDRK